jgi:hypothetical protein
MGDVNDRCDALYTLSRFQRQKNEICTDYSVGGLIAILYIIKRYYIG